MFQSLCSPPPICLSARGFLYPSSLVCISSWVRYLWSDQLPDPPPAEIHRPFSSLAPMASVAARTWSMLTPATSAIVILWELVQLHDNIVWWDHAPCSSVTKLPCAHSPESQQNSSNRSLSFRLLSPIAPSCNMCPTVLLSFLPAQILDVFPQPLTWRT